MQATTSGPDEGLGDATESGDPVEQHKRNKYIDLVANAIMLHNVVDMTHVINRLVREEQTVTPELVSFLSPYMRGHIKRFGQYMLDLDDIPNLWSNRS